jgi:hypothetical protein
MYNGGGGRRKREEGEGEAFLIFSKRITRVNQT